MSKGQNAEYFCHSGTSKHKTIFNWRIDSFSIHAHRGCRKTSDVFDSSPESQWRLTLSMDVDTIDDKCVDFINLHLENIKCNKRQFVKVKLSIVDCLGRLAESSMMDVVYDSFNTSEKVFSLSKDYLMTELLGFNRILLVPDDVLTLRCEMSVVEENEPVPVEPEYVYRRNNDQSSLLKVRLFLLWLTEAVVHMRPALFRGWWIIRPVLNPLAPYWIAILCSIVPIYLGFDVIVWIISTVYWILKCTVWCLLTAWDLRVPLSWALLVWCFWKTNKYINALMSKNKSKEVVPYQNPRNMNVYQNSKGNYYIVPESSMQSLYVYLKSQMSLNNQPGVVMGKRNIKKRPNHTYYDQ